VGWVKTITELSTALAELIKAFAHLAWPGVVGLIVWWFRREIPIQTAVIMERIWKFKGFGVEFEALNQEQVRLSLDNAKAGIPEEKIQETQDVIQHVKQEALSTSSATATTRLVEAFVIWSTSRPRILGTRSKGSWYLLARGILEAAKISGENLQPDSTEISNALKRLEANAEFSDGLIRSIKNLQGIARKVFCQS
jgi:hypothetical protein